MQVFHVTVARQRRTAADTRRLIGRRAVGRKRNRDAGKIEAAHTACQANGVVLPCGKINYALTDAAVIRPTARLLHSQIIAVACRVARRVHLGGRAVRCGIIHLQQRLAAVSAVNTAKFRIRPADVQIVDTVVPLGRTAAHGGGVETIGGRFGILRKRLAARTGVIALDLAQCGHAFGGLDHRLNGAVGVEIQPIDADRTQRAVARDRAIVIEQIPVAFILHHRTVSGIAAGALQHHTAIGPRTERRSGGGVAHLIFAHRIVRIHEIVRIAALKHPRSLVEVLQPFHLLHRTVDGHHVRAELAAHGDRTAADVDVVAAIVVLEHAGVDQ